MNAWRRLWFVLMAAVLAVGCQTNETVVEAPIDSPLPTFTGPDYLRGSVQSMVTVRGFEPLMVSGYGLVVNLNGTGSTGVPAFLRQYMINYARRMGVGSARLMDLSEQYPRLQQGAEAILADPDTAVVEVYGLIPPGSVPGSRFDLVVRALEQTQTTSLAGGELWQTDLGIDGANPQLLFTRTLAQGRGAIYADPFDRQSASSDQRMQFERQAVIVGGGRATLRRPVQLILNQPSWSRSAAIANRINERFPAGPQERFTTAEAKTDVIVEINIPRRFSHDPQQLLSLIGKVFIQGGPGFEERKTRQIMQVLRTQPETAQTMVLAMRALGKTTLPSLSRFYEDRDFHVQLAALEAGAALEDERAVDYLSALMPQASSEQRVQIAEILGHVIRFRSAQRALAALLDDPEMDVRLAAYEALQQNPATPFIERYPVRDNFGVRYVIDRVVAAQKPAVYVTQDRTPKIVIFGPAIFFPDHFLARIWDGRLMLRSTESGGALELFYLAPGTRTPKILIIQPSLETLAYVLGQTPTRHDPQSGLGLSYGHVVDAIYELLTSGVMDIPIFVKNNPLIDRVERERERGPVQERPVFATEVTEEMREQLQRFESGVIVEDSQRMEIQEAAPPSQEAAPTRPDFSDF